MTLHLNLLEPLASLICSLFIDLLIFYSSSFFFYSVSPSLCLSRISFHSPFLHLQFCHPILFYSEKGDHLSNPSTWTTVNHACSFYSTYAFFFFSFLFCSASHFSKQLTATPTYPSYRSQSQSGGSCSLMQESTTLNVQRRYFLLYTPFTA